MTDNHHSGGVSGLIGRILSFVDQPWKAAFILVTLIIVGFGYALWQERAQIVGWVLMPQPSGLDRANMSADLEKTLDNTGADIVAVWSLDARYNALYFESGRQRSNTNWQFSPHRILFIIKSSVPEKIVEFLAGHTLCDGRDNVYSLLAQRLNDEGIRRICFAPIPQHVPVVGLLLVGWHEIPDPAHDATSIGIINEMAGELAK